MTEVELPDGTILEFPDGMSGDDIKAAIQKRFAPQKERTLTDKIKDNVFGVDDGVMSPGEKLATALNMGGEGLTLGLVGDEAAAAADSLVGRGGYDERLAQYRGNEAQFREENPIMALASEAIPAMAVPAGAALSGGGLLARAGKSALAAGTGAGLWGFMEGEGGLENRLQNAIAPAAIGGTLGAAVPVGGTAVSRVLKNRAVRKAAKAAPTRNETKAAASKIFDYLDQQDVPTDQLAGAVGAAGEKISRRGVNPKLTPKSAAVFEDLTDLATEPTSSAKLGDLMDIRKQTRAARGDFTNPEEQRAGGIIAKAIDDYVSRVAPQLGDAGKEANKMWSTLKKMDEIDEIFVKASRQASGVENGLRIEFRKILNNPKKRAGYSAAEIAAMEKVVKPGLLPSLIRQVGRFGFSLDNGSNALGGALGGATGGLVGGLPGAIAMTALGTSARKGSEVMTERAAQRVADIVRAGNVQLPASIGQTQNMFEELLTRAARAGAMQTQ